MALSNAQLLMLDNLIYTKYCKNDATVGDIINNMAKDLDKGKSIEGCMMSNEEWRDLIAVIQDEPSLLNYTVQNYENNTNTGMRAACFVDNVENPTDVNVVFRGTSSDYEWHDNGEGGYLSDTDQQQAAAEYVNNLPDKYGNNMTVTGHSKGGNKAQYVTIVTDRIAKCVSYDGQGFSEEFIQKYEDEIAKKSQSIISISASDDFVNCLLYPIAGTKIYIETEGQDNFLHYHKPNILFDDNGNLRPQTEQSDLSKFINEYTTYMVSNLEEPERSITINGLIAIMEKGETKEPILQTIYAGGNAITHLDDFAFNYIGENYGKISEFAVCCLLATSIPYIFLDDLLNCGKEMLDSVIGEMLNLADKISQKLQAIGQKAAEYAKKFVDAITTFANKTKEWFNKNFNKGYQYATTNSYINVNTNALIKYADRLRSVNQRIVSLDRRMDGLYTKVGLLGLWDLMQADALTGYSWRISRCINYLSDTAYEFEATERSIFSQL